MKVGSVGAAGRQRPDSMGSKARDLEVIWGTGRPWKDFKQGSDTVSATAAHTSAPPLYFFQFFTMRKFIVVGMRFYYYCFKWIALNEWQKQV